MAKIEMIEPLGTTDAEEAYHRGTINGMRHAVELIDAQVQDLVEKTRELDHRIDAPLYFTKKEIRKYKEKREWNDSWIIALEHVAGLIKKRIALAESA